EEDTAVPVRQAAQGSLDVLPRHGEQHVVQTRRFLDSRHRRAPAEFAHLVGKRTRTAPTAQDNLMSSGERLTRNRKRDLTCPDRPDPHRPVLSILSEAELSATAFLPRRRLLQLVLKSHLSGSFLSATALRRRL